MVPSSPLPVPMRAAGRVARARRRPCRCSPLLPLLLLFLVQSPLTVQTAAVPSHASLCVGQQAFTVQLNHQWNSQLPTSDAAPHRPAFTPLLCLAHSAHFSLWEVGSVASPAVQDLVLRNNATKLEQLLAKEQSVVFFDRARRDRTPRPHSDNVIVIVDPALNATRISCISSLRPSPGWFVGISALQVCKIPRATSHFGVRVFDAELDDLETFAGEHSPLAIPRPIRLRPDTTESTVGWFSVEPVGRPSLAQLPGSRVSRQLSEPAVAPTPVPTLSAPPSATPTLTPSPSPPVVGKCVGMRTFTVRLDYNWKPQFVPPDLDPPAAGFTPLVCAAHNANFSLWKVGSMASDAVQDLVVEKNITALLQKLYAHRKQNQSIVSYNRSSLPNVASPGYDSVNVTVDPEFNATLISCIAAFWPSPDWFVGVSAIQVCEKGDASYSYSQLSELKLRAFDAELDDRETFTGVRKPIETARPVRVRPDISENLGIASVYDLKAKKVLKTSRKTSEPPDCFPGSSMVLLGDGSWARIDELQTSMSVRVGGGSTSDIFMFSHRDSGAKSTFVRASFARADNSTAALVASRGHYVYTLGRDGRKLTAMGEVREGTSLVGVDGKALMVHSVEVVSEVGLFNPHSVQGDLVVDGVLVSSFTRAVEPQFARRATWMFARLYEMGLGGLVDQVTTALLSGRLNHMLARLVPSGA